MARVGSREERGWRLLVLENESVRLEVLAERGATITSLRDRRTGLELLWQPRWGIPHRDRIDAPGSSEAVSMGRYAGGWHTLFPNAGGPAVEHGVEWPMHGEVWLAPFDLESMVAGVLEFRTVLVRSPFEFRRRIELDGARVTVTETARNLGDEIIDVVWNQHPTFDAPLLGPGTRLDSSGRDVLPDVGDPRLAGRCAGRWPWSVPAVGDADDLRTPPSPRSGVSRRAFLGGLDGERARVRIENSAVDLSVVLEWDPGDFPYAWYWLEAGGRPGFPWFGGEYVLGIEPCTSYPTGGIGEIRRLTGTQVAIEPGTTQTRAVTLEVGSATGW